MDEEKKTGQKKVTISLWLDEYVVMALDRRSRDIERSRSWLVNHILKETKVEEQS